MYRARTPAVNFPDPVPHINITPLIDVMLVLIVMLILSIPIATHKVPLDLPQAGPAAPVPDTPPHRLDIAADGALLWDLQPVADAALPSLLATALREDPRGVLHMRTDPEARYERFDEVLATLKRSGITSLGFLDHRPLPD